MAEKSHIFLDFDNSKFDTNTLFMNYINERYTISSQPEDYTSNTSYERIVKKYLPKELCPSDDDFWEDFGKNVLASIEKHEHIAPMEDMVETVIRLAEKYTLWVVTARPTKGLAVIEHMLNKHVPNCIHGIHCVWSEKEGGGYIDVPKRAFVQSIVGEKIAFFDDSIEEIEKMHDLLPCYLYDPQGIHNAENSIRSWKEFGALFL